MSNSGLLEGWELDYDGKRWFYTYKATGAVKYKWPQPGDEFPDFYDPSRSSILPPEDRLAIQQQQTKGKKQDELRKTFASGMSTTGCPMAFYDNEEFGDTEFFQPDALMYMSLGAYNDVSPIGVEDIEQPLPAGISELPPNSSAGVGAKVSPIASEKSTSMTQHSRLNTPAGSSFAARVAEPPLMSSYAELPLNLVVQPPLLAIQQPAQMLDNREIHSSTQRRTVVSDPIGFISEIPTEFTGLAPIDTKPIELGDYRVLAPIESEALSQTGPPIPDIAELPSVSIDPTQNNQEQQDREKIRSQQKPYGERHYPFQPNHEVQDQKPQPPPKVSAPALPPKVSAPALPPKIPHDETSSTTPNDLKFQPFKPGAAVSTSTISTAQRPFNHARRPSDIKNPRLSMLAGAHKHHLHISASQPQLKITRNSHPISGLPSPPKLPKTPMLPIYNGGDQPPLSLQPGVLAKNNVLPLVQATKSPSPQRKPVLPYPDDEPVSGGLPYPDHDHMHGHDVIFDLQLPDAVPPHVRTHRSASMPMAPPVGLQYGGNQVLSALNNSVPSLFIQHQQPMHRLCHQQPAFIGEVAALRASTGVQNIPPLQINAGVGIVRHDTTAPYPGALTHHVDGHEHRVHTCSFSSNIAESMDTYHHRRRSSGVSALSSPSPGPQSADGTSNISSVSSATPGSNSDASSGRRPSVPQSKTSNTSEYQSEYFPPAISLMSPDLGAHRQSPSLANEMARQRNQIKRKSSTGVNLAATPSNNQYPLAGLQRIRPMLMLAFGESAKVTPSATRSFLPFHAPNQSLHAINELPPPGPPLPPKTPVMDPNLLASEFPSTSRKSAQPDTDGVSVKTRPQRQVIKSMLFETSVPSSSISSLTPKAPSAGAAPAAPSSLFAPTHEVAPQMAAKTRPVSLPTPSRTSMPSSVQAYKPKLMQQYSPPIKEPKEKTKWLSKIFKGSKHKVSPSFKVLNTAPSGVTVDPVNFPVGWKERTRPSHGSAGAECFNGSFSLAHQDGLRSHAPFARNTGTNNVKHPPSSSIDTTLSALANQSVSSYNNTNATQQMTISPSSHHHILHEMPSVPSIVRSPPSISSIGSEVPSLLSQAVSRNTSGHSTSQRSFRASEPGVLDVGDDYISDQVPASTIDISEAKVQPVLHSQFVQIPSTTSSQYSSGPIFEMAANNELRTLLLDDSITPLALRNKSTHKYLPAFPSATSDHLRTTGMTSAAYEKTKDNKMPTQTSSRHTSKNYVLEAKLMNALFSQDMDSGETSGRLVLEELEVEPLLSPTEAGKQPEYLVGSLMATPPRSVRGAEPRAGGMSPLFSSTRVEIEDEGLVPRPLSPRSPSGAGKGLRKEVGGSMSGEGKLVMGASRLKGMKMPALDYTGEGGRMMNGREGRERSYYGTFWEVCSICVA